jgi:iron-sulfur cluster assembly accessory protein
MTVATVEETAVISLTETAADKLIGIMNEKGLAGTHGLRVFVSGGGCSGLQYGMTFDAAPRPVDIVLEQHGLRVIIDPQSLRYMEGAEIDFVDGPTGGGFHIENPNATATCGSGGCSGCH